MGKLTLYGLKMSTCTRRALLVLEEKNAHFEFKEVNLQKGEHKSPEFLERQPFGVIPVLYDDDFKVYESRAIVRYLDETLPGVSLTPKDPKHRALVEQWISIEMSYHKKADEIVGELMFSKMFGRTPNMANVEAHSKVVHDLYKIMDKHLAGKTYLVGDSFTIADLVFMPYLDYLLKCEGFGNVLDAYPNVKHWWTTISSRPAWKKVAA